MMPLRLGAARSVVLLGAHPDDIEIGAGGLLLALGDVPGLRVHYVLLTGTPDRQAEARAAAGAFLPHARLSFALHDLPDGRVPARWGEAKQIVDAAASTLAADLVLAPTPDDAHQDHHTLAALVPTSFRDATVLYYEIPKWDGDLGRRNVYLPLTEERARRKVELLHAGYPSQKARDWWDDEVFLGLARLRGMECRSRYAEAFRCEKAVIEP
ncbi:PIG-L deacetylase family protein [Plantactinospora soyae]|uniref:LmbE family N-acetylglucosaminyl deacetylase n=1 Tax=Plantactinospora soyae TaxID=1544732 RepID=A0A927M593_9ACTN|nr:PIG-L family deacetylase [Plantactinospora soyae]MBE1484720.1 LmbE family N-acetylglucosaminyl deacetylase [Plantactinospora soyae]